MSNSLNQITKFQRELGEKGWQAAEERATRFCNLNTSQRDNSYFIANLLITGGPSTQYDNGVVMTITVNLEDIMENINNEIERRLKIELAPTTATKLTTLR